MSRDFSLEKKIVWLVGASSGIGEALVSELASIHCTLVVSARRAEKLEEVILAQENSKADIVSMPLDVCSREEVIAAATEINQKFGTIDVLIANAGTHIPTSVEKFDVAEYESLFAVNFFGALNCVQAVLPQMKEKAFGHLVVVSSVAGYRALPNAAAYGASKAALTHFMESLRFELESYNIAVSVVSPGFVKTPLTDKNDFSMPFLISAKRAASEIRKGVERGKFEIAFPLAFVFILKTLGLLPKYFYHKLIMRRVLS